MFRLAAAEVNRFWHLPNNTQSDVPVKWGLMPEMTVLSRGRTYDPVLSHLMPRYQPVLSRDRAVTVRVRAGPEAAAVLLRGWVAKASLS